MIVDRVYSTCMFSQLFLFFFGAVGRYKVNQLAVFDYMVEKELMLYTHETNFRKTNANKAISIMIIFTFFNSFFFFFYICTHINMPCSTHTKPVSERQMQTRHVYMCKNRNKEKKRKKKRTEKK